MELLTLQDVFNKVWPRSKILVKSMNTGTCFYRDPKREAPPCFIGVCLTDYDFGHGKLEDIDGGVIGLRLEGRLPKKFDNIDENALHDLQVIHDHKDPETWEKYLRLFADKHKLTIPETVQ